MCADDVGCVALRTLFGKRATVHHIADRLGDVCGVVSHPLDVLGAEQQMNAERDVAMVFRHVGQQLAEKRGVHGVDLVIALAYRFFVEAGGLMSYGPN